MKILYISDLDGTLLGKSAKLSDRSVRLINEALDDGMLFAAATARSPATALNILSPLHLNLPICMLNGSFFYDSLQQKYLEIKEIDRDTVEKIAALAKRHQKMPLYYSIYHQQLTVFYQIFDNEVTGQFVEERKDTAYKKFVKVQNLDEIPADAQVVFLVFVDQKEILDLMIEELDREEAIRYSYYHDVYQPDQYYLEISSISASKAAAAKWLKSYTGAKRVLAFGDNSNDLPMLTFADEAYVPENATEPLKTMANRILPPCEEDSVALFIHQDYFKGEKHL